MAKNMYSKENNTNTKSKGSILNERTNYYSGSTNIEEIDPSNKKFLNIALKDQDPKLIEIQQVSAEEFHMKHSSDLYIAKSYITSLDKRKIVILPLIDLTLK